MKPSSSPVTSSRHARRSRTHGACLAAAAAVTAAVAAAFPASGALERWSGGLAYAGLAFLAAALAVGPLLRLARRTDPVHVDLRRDLGMWSAALGIVHAALGLRVHLEGSLRAYFLAPGPGVRPRLDPFGLANHAGLAAAALLAVLLALSSDRALRALGRARWKRLQRAAPAAAALVVLHGAAYQAVERRPLPFVALFTLGVLALALPRLLARLRRQ